MKQIVFCLLLAALLTACTSPAPSTTTDAAPTPAASTGDVTPVIARTSELLDQGDELPEVGQLAPDFAFTLTDGNTTRLSELRGKKVILNFWATWCGPCQTEMPDLQQALQRYDDSLVVIGVNRGQHADLLAPFARQFGLSFPLVADSETNISDRYDARLLPMSFFINTDGTIGERKLGVMTYDTITEKVDALK